MRYQLSIAVVIIASLFAPHAAAQDDFFRMSPGALSKPHAKWDATKHCTVCHELGGGISNLKCLGCHDHRDLAQAIKKGHGLHAGFKRPCIDCHSEHDGRSGNITNWDVVGGRSNFDHKRTGFILSGAHARVPCAACHKKRLSSGRTSYTGLSKDCNDCHDNPHDFTNAKLRSQCLSCHKPGVAPRAMRAATVPFDHGKATGIELVGKHGRARCVECHKGGSMGREVPRACQHCHKTKHDKAFRSKPCITCHTTPARPFKRASPFDHDKTKFPLTGKHTRVKCAKCHDNRDARPQPGCAKCHEDPHRKRFEKLTCETCHLKGGFKKFTFDHTVSTKFPLTGKHQGLECRKCHRGRKPYEFEKNTLECKDCHAHKDAHAKDPDGQFHSKPCTACHTEGGSKKKLAFDHNRDARFALTGAHERLRAAGKCEKCHPKEQFRTGKLKCVDCHGEKDPHKKKLGDACDTCHIPEKGAPKFVHATMTPFPRAGTHEKVPCPFCHQPAPASGPPKVGWTKGLTPPEKVDRLFPVMGKRCADCHFDQHEGRYGKECGSCHDSISFKNVGASRHDSGAFQLTGVHDTIACVSCHQPGVQLEAQGELCTRCHLDDDRHRFALGPFCGDCHTQIEWRPAHWSHVESGYALHGAHRVAECDGCHGIGVYAGTPTECEMCHLQDSARATDPVHTGELILCERCHVPAAFIPARRSHPEWPITGRHLLVSCRNCHGTGTYSGTPTACSGCHLSQYLDPGNDPNHIVEGHGTFCDDCHSTVGWRPAREP